MMSRAQLGTVGKKYSLDHIVRTSEGSCNLHLDDINYEGSDQSIQESISTVQSRHSGFQHHRNLVKQYRAACSSINNYLWEQYESDSSDDSIYRGRDSSIGITKSPSNGQKCLESFLDKMKMQSNKKHEIAFAVSLSTRRKENEAGYRRKSQSTFDASAPSTWNHKNQDLQTISNESNSTSGIIDFKVYTMQVAHSLGSGRPV